MYCKRIVTSFMFENDYIQPFKDLIVNISLIYSQKEMRIFYEALSF